MSAPHAKQRPAPLARAAAVGLGLLMAAGCGDSPARSAGTIELPPRSPERKEWKPPSRAARTAPASPR